ncbi:MAG: hypothetical protein COB36_03525 [Alphaproteobacteria bacterium]|nr:MAG: hypothetical protein COB36_03525 [Alphaproteobacteria bacterium]
MLRGKPHHRAFIMLVFILSGCQHLPKYDQKSAVDLNHPYTAEVKTDGATSQPPANVGWWKLYADEELNTLMRQAFARNPDINQIRARLNQANAQVRQSQAARLPALNVTGGRSTFQGDNTPSSDYAVIGTASFELDLWGKNKANDAAAKLNAQASAEDLHTAHITLSASIVENWLDILSLLEQETLLRKQIKVNRTVLELQQKRFEMGSSSALSVLQQEEILAQSEAGLPDILSAEKQALNNLTLLVGDTPYKGLIISEKTSPEALPIPDTGLPSDLLKNRPDIIAAWLRLRSAQWASKAAWANRLPNFDLSATYTTGATALNSLFNTWLLDLAASVAAPVFDGGNRKAEQFRQEAIADERYHAYRETVLNAVIEVENALVRNMYQDQKIAALNNQLLASDKTLKQAQLSYTNGSSDYVNVLNSLNNTQSLVQQITREHLKQAKERVGLYRALGGRSWAANFPLEQNESNSETIVKDVEDD